MANFFSDNKDLQFHLQHPAMRKIVELKERGFAEKDLYDYAPQNFDDAMDSYRRVLEIAGEVCGDVIAPNAEGVDHEGPRVVNDHVEYASGTVQNMKAIVDAGLSGLTLPRKYDGLNFPLVCFVMANEMVARADAGFENIWGLQDCAETLNEFASEEIKQKFLPWVSAGATCAMDLTEPDAGSDLGAVMLKATWSEEKQTWLLNGVKRFITNGDGEVSLVLARTEEGTTDARGLSMLVYDKRDGGVKVRRIENKLGIKGSPTCELVFTNAPAQLVGDRKMGLIKYVMSLMNAARLGIGAQSVGTCEAAYREALKYAHERAQFGKPIIRFAAVSEMLSNMKAKLQGARALLYETTRFVEIYKQYTHISHERSLEADERQEMKFYTRLAVGFNAGLMGEVMIPGIGFGIDFAVKYAMVGADADFGKKLVWSSDGWGKENVRLHTIQVPLNLRFKWTRLNGVEDIVAPFAYAGPLFQFQCSSTQKGLFDIPAGSVGVQVGIGAEFLKRIQLSAGYHFGLTYALKTVKLENISAKTSNWQINLAYLFGK